MKVGAPGRVAPLVGGLILWLAVLSLIASSAVAASTATYRDTFATISYGGSDGSASWSGSWVEFGESDGPASGDVSVQSDSRCAAGNCGYLSGHGSTAAGIYRVADLSGASSATLTFSYRRVKVGNNPSLVRVSASGNGGATWSTVAAYTLDTSDPAQVAAAIGISSWISADTAIRFRVESSPGQGGRMYFDNVQISAEVPDPTTTTTSTTAPPTTTTTTTEPPVTTTSSTTTTAPPTSTTTLPPVSTTTTTTTTSTIPPGTTTTTLSPPTSSLGPPDPVTTTTVPQSSTTLEPASTTTLGPVALPGSGAGPVRPPFPIDPASGSAFLGSASRVVVAQGVDVLATNDDVSSMVVLALSDEIVAGVGDSKAAGPQPLPGGLGYLWPGLAIIGMLSGVGVVRGRASERPTN